MDTTQLNNLHKLLTSGRRYKMPKGQIIQSSNERYRYLLNLVKTGYVKRYEISNDGSLAVQAVYGSGYVFPLTIVFKTLLDQDIYESPETIYYEAMADTEIYSIEMDRLVQHIEKDPLLYRDLLIEAGVRIHSNLQGLENLSLKSSYRRTAHQLAYYARQFGENKNSPIKISVMLTHQDIADILSLTRETVSINMHKLQERHLIKAGRYYIEVLDLEKLEKVAYGQEAYGRLVHSPGDAIDIRQNI